MAIKCFVFQVEALQFSKFHENEIKHGKGNLKKGLNMIFNVKKLVKLLERMAQKFSSLFLSVGK